MTKSNRQIDYELITQQRALSAYLKALLTDVNNEKEEQHISLPEPPLESQHHPSIIEAASLLNKKKELQVNNLSSELAQIEEISPVKRLALNSKEIVFPDFELDSEKEVPDIIPAPEPAITIEKKSNEKFAETVPKWAKSDFQVLSFNVNNVIYAAPLDRFFGILPMPQELTLLPGRKPWFLGLHRNRDINMQVIDFSLLLPANKIKADLTENKQIREQFILLIDQGHWGIVAQKVDNVLTLKEKAVSWRTDTTTGSIVIGTVVEKMCTLIDIDVVVERLNGGFWDK